MCLDVMNTTIGSIVNRYQCQQLNGDQGFAYMRNHRIMFHTDECIGVRRTPSQLGLKAVILDKCSNNDQYQKWEFDQDVSERKSPDIESAVENTVFLIDISDTTSSQSTNWIMYDCSWKLDVLGSLQYFTYRNTGMVHEIILVYSF